MNNAPRLGNYEPILAWYARISAHKMCNYLSGNSLPEMTKMQLTASVAN